MPPFRLTLGLSSVAAGSGLWMRLERRVATLAATIRQAALRHMAVPATPLAQTDGRRTQ
jgi:hypothetical protein